MLLNKVDGEGGGSQHWFFASQMEVGKRSSRNYRRWSSGY
jgi:hypothetical protein